MNQNEFFNILMDGLKDFPESKLRDIISYYDNEFTNGLASGKTEDEIIAKLGNPNLIVNQYKSEFPDTEDMPIHFHATGSSDSNKEINNVNTSASISNSKIITEEESASTTDVPSGNSNADNHKYENDFITMDNHNASDNILKAEYASNNSNDNIDTILNNTKYSTPYEDINSNNDFYDLYTKNQPVKNEESNYDSNSSETSTSNYNTGNYNSGSSRSTVNLILKFCIIAVTLLIFSPVITGIIGCIIGLFGVAISILVGSIGLLVGGTFTSLVGVPNIPMFVANFPYPVIVLFSLGSISLSLFLTLVFYYLCKFFVRILIKSYRALKLKGGDL